MRLDRKFKSARTMGLESCVDVRLNRFFERFLGAYRKINLEVYFESVCQVL